MENDVDLKEDLRVRGRKFVELQGIHYLQYNGYIIEPHKVLVPQMFPQPGLMTSTVSPESMPIKSLHFQVT